MKGFFSILLVMLILISCAKAPRGSELSYENSESHKDLTKEELKKMEGDKNPTYY